MTTSSTSIFQQLALINIVATSSITLILAGFTISIIPDHAQAAPKRCKPGFVWREATPNDFVCVPPSSRAKAKSDNRRAVSRISPDGGEYGALTCKSGYVWREATGNTDRVCVKPSTRTRTRKENQLGPSRTVQSIRPAPESSGGSGSTSADAGSSSDRGVCIKIREKEYCISRKR